MMIDGMPMQVPPYQSISASAQLGVPTDLSARKTKEDAVVPQDTAEVKEKPKGKKKKEAPKTDAPAEFKAPEGPTPEIVVMREGGLKMLTDNIKEAKESIDIHIYIITANTPELMSSLKDALGRGVKLRLMVEDDPFYWSEFKSDPSQKAVQELVALGAEYKPDNPQFSKDRVTHEKSIVFDGKKGLILTGNLGSTTFDKNLDLGAILIDNKKVVEEMKTIFECDWNRVPTPEMEDVGLVISPDNARAKLEGFIGSAKKSIHILQQGFSDKDIISLIGRKLDEGVETQLTLTDPSVAQGGMQTGAYLSMKGAKVKFLTTPYIHAKAISIDSADADKSDDRAYVGSQNFSFSAINKNRELGIIYNDKTDQLEAIMDRYRKQGFDIPSKMLVSDNSNLGSSLKAAIRTAEKEIIVETSLFSDKQIRGNLGKAAENGVKVKVLMPQNPFPWDPNCKFNIEAAEEMKAKGVEVQWTDGAYKQMQGTCMVVDGKEAIVFPDNLSAAAFNKNNNFGILNINEKEVAEIQKQLDADWAGTPKANAAPADPSSELITSPGNARQQIGSLLKGANSSIYMEVKDLSDSEMAKILKEKAKSGIPVKVIIPEKKKQSDYQKKLIDEMKASGVQIEQLSFEPTSNNFIEIDREKAYVGSIQLSRDSMDQSRGFGCIATSQEMVNIGHKSFGEHWLTATVDQAKDSVHLEKKFVSDGDRFLTGILKSLTKQGVKVTVTTGNYDSGMLKMEFDKLNESLRNIANLDPEKDLDNIAKFFNTFYDKEKAKGMQDTLKAALAKLKPGEELISGTQKDPNTILKDQLKVDGKDVDMMTPGSSGAGGGEDQAAAMGATGTLSGGISYCELFPTPPEEFADAEELLLAQNMREEE
ncbi:MAG: phosphatidylserine/phosphatidylglycerophosphate/cardiolipin synthase family protein [Candidatus Xenobiia bacterium LiM19]